MRLARIALLVGAVVDTLAAVQLLLPASFSMLGFVGLREGGSAGQLAVESAALLLGWAVVEVWASLEPSRRWPVVAVGFCVLLVYLAQNVLLLSGAHAEFSEVLPFLVLQIALAILFAAALASLRKMLLAHTQPARRADPAPCELDSG